MSPEDIIQLHGSKKLPDNQTLIKFSLSEYIVEHSQFSVGMAAIAETHAKRNALSKGVGLLLMAESGFGKTILLKKYQSLFPRQMLANIVIIRVLYVVLPSNPSSLAIASEILLALGDPLALKKSESAAIKTQPLYKYLKDCKVEVILMDEPHHMHISLNTPEFYTAQNWLKNLISIGKVAVVASGMPHSKYIFKSNNELKRRFLKQVTLTNFTFNYASSFEEFRSILKKYEGLLPFKCEIPLYERNLARRILIACGGLLDYLAKLLDGAVQIAQFMHKPIINVEVLAASFREYIWDDGPENLNPFHPNSPLRPLDKFGEPYHTESKHDRGAKK